MIFTSWFPQVGAPLSCFDCSDPNIAACLAGLVYIGSLQFQAGQVLYNQCVCFWTEVSVHGASTIWTWWCSSKIPDPEVMFVTNNSLLGVSDVNVHSCYK